MSSGNCIKWEKQKGGNWGDVVQKFKVWIEETSRDKIVNLLGILFSFCIVNTAAFIGILKYLFGRASGGSLLIYFFSVFYSINVDNFFFVVYSI